MKAAKLTSRLRSSQIQRHFSTSVQQRLVETYQGMANVMATKLSIESKYNMPSGFEIPVLGFGVSILFHLDNHLFYVQALYRTSCFQCRWFLET